MQRLSREQNDRLLIQACRKGDSRAWEVLVEKYERLVFFIPLKHGLSRDDAADVAQYCFINLMEKLDSLDDDSNLAAWLSTVAQRRTWRLIQKTKREEELDESALVVTAAVQGLKSGPGRLEGHQETLEWLMDGLENLNEKCRELLLALYFDWDEPSYEEVARRLGMRLGSIGPTRARCLERLRKILPDF